MDNEKFLQPSQAAKLLDVTTRTLLLGKKKGKLKLSELVEDTGDISSLVSQTTKNLSNKKKYLLL